MKKLFLLALCLAANAADSPAAEVTIDAFLASASYDYALETQNAKLEFLSTASPNTPYLDRVEFRTRTDELESSQQIYILRFYPTGWGETSNGRQLFDATIQANKAQRDLLLHQVLGKRYHLIVDYRYTHAQAALTRNLLLLQEDRVTVLKRKVDTIDFDLDDLIESENDVIRLQLETMEKENELHAVETEIRQHLRPDDTIAFAEDEVIGPSALGRTVQQLEITSSVEAENIYLQDSWQRVEQERCEYNLEKSQSRRYVSYLETLYDNEERGHSRQAFAFEVGIRLPFISPDRLAINRQKLDYLEEKRLHEDLKQTLGQEETRLRGEVERLVAQYNRLARAKEADGWDATITRYQQMEGADPLILLKMRESMLKRDSALNELRYKIYSAYIDLLDLSGYLSKQPLRNYLSSHLEETRL